MHFLHCNKFWFTLANFADMFSATFAFWQMGTSGFRTNVLRVDLYQKKKIKIEIERKIASVNQFFVALQGEQWYDTFSFVQTASKFINIESFRLVNSDLHQC